MGRPGQHQFKRELPQGNSGKKNDTSVDPKQQYISRLSKTCVYKAGHGVSSCSLWSMPSEHGASSWGIIMGHLYRFMGHHHLEHEHAQANAACNNATSNCSSERPSHVTLLWTLHWTFFSCGPSEHSNIYAALTGIIIWSMSMDTRRM